MERDAACTAMRLGGGTGCAAAGNGTRNGRKPSGLGCLEETDSDGPRLSPLNSAEVLSKFSATLINAGGRDLALGGALYAHMQPSNAEDDAELHGGKAGSWVLLQPGCARCGGIARGL